MTSGSPSWLLQAVVLCLMISPAVASGQPQVAVPTIPTTEERLRALEEQNRELTQRLNALGSSYQELKSQAALPTVETEERSEKEDNYRAIVDLERGLRATTRDGRYRFEIHDLTQVEGRAFSPTGDQLADTFAIPRQRFYFLGQVGDLLDFTAVLNRGYGSLDVLDAYMDFKFDKRFQIRFGRTKTPYTYEYYRIAESDLIAPERSVFVGNLSPNRQIGVMAFGKLWDERIDYAVGLFNGPRRSFQDFNNAKNPFFYLATQPFLRGNSDLLRHLSLGGSANFGRANDPLEPSAFRTANDETTSQAVDTLSPTFLRLNSNARQLGSRAFWSGDVAWFYRSLTALAGYNGGFITYSLPSQNRIRVPYTGYSVALTYFLTGEEITSRRDIEPDRPFKLGDPWHNPGAVEPYARLAYFNAGRNVFDSGLADPRVSSRDATVLDMGMNWYVNRYLRVFGDWQYSRFSSPVAIGTTQRTSHENLFWLRAQLYY